jgi:hypothetical protein
MIYRAGMPMLPNPKHEQFAQHVATSARTKWSNGRCYTEAGFKTEDRSADACAARLLTNANVQARIAELIEPTVKKTRTTVDTLAEQLDRVFDGALTAEQFGAAGTAAGLKARLLGFMRTQIEIGSAGQFDKAESIEDVVKTMLQDQSPSECLELLDVLRRQVEAVAGDHAAIVVEPARSPTPGRETELALAELRPKRFRR